MPTRLQRRRPYRAHANYVDQSNTFVVYNAEDATSPLPASQVPPRYILQKPPNFLLSSYHVLFYLTLDAIYALGTVSAYYPAGLLCVFSEPLFHGRFPCSFL